MLTRISARTTRARPSAPLGVHHNNTARRERSPPAALSQGARQPHHRRGRALRALLAAAGFLAWSACWKPAFARKNHVTRDFSSGPSVPRCQTLVSFRDFSYTLRCQALPFCSDRLFAKLGVVWLCRRLESCSLLRWSAALASKWEHRCRHRCLCDLRVVLCVHGHQRQFLLDAVPRSARH